MSGFAAEWLGLRERADAAARSRRLAQSLTGGYRRIVDLGAGTGANLRWLAPELGAEQHWTLIDNDRKLLTAARNRTRSWANENGYRMRGRGRHWVVEGTGFACTVDACALDLKTHLDAIDWPRGGLVTASALLDLVSLDWLTDVVARVSAAGAAVNWALTYDGRIRIDPADESDTFVIDAFNRHQRTDKGFGPALGPDAWLVAQSLLERAGFSVRTVDSSWDCGASDRSLIVELVAGIAAAASAIEPDEQRIVDRWCKDRLGRAKKGKLQVSVGHRDIVALPGA
ncbi:MAG: class I SAM-dependent methyltransferase [Gammaproteobacteria bacterium]|nr:class I SAM-dependent methyltransferase [Gammaproteobacteria bacterium]